MIQTVRLIPETSEGYFLEQGLHAPLPFTAIVGERGSMRDFPIEGWDGEVIEGQGQFTGQRVILTRRLEGYNGGVVAYVFAAKDTNQQIFSGTCLAKGLK
jgi:hypothetical protein